MKTITKKLAMLVVLTILSLTCLRTIILLESRVGAVLHIGSFVLPISSLQGIISALNMMLCILMVFIQYNHGARIASGIITISMVGSTIHIFRSHTLSPLPGNISSLITLISIFIIYYFYKRSSLNSYTDLITDLKNRRKFMEDIADKVGSKEEFLLACIEIEGFKQINDMYGMQAGDYVLRKTAEFLQKNMGKKDTLYKITGATFIAIFDKSEEGKESLKNMIVTRHLPVPSGIEVHPGDERNCLISLAAGVSDSTLENFDSKAIVNHADIALSVAKKNENAKICYYTEELEDAEKQQREAEALVRESLEQGYFYLVYQPQFNLSDKKLRGFESLIRCKKPDGTIISPGVFIPVAEKSNLILRIDDYVLRRAMNEFKDILAEKGNKYTISVNVSAKNMASSDFTDRVKKIIDETNFPAECLEIEITEYSLADSLETTVENIKKLRMMGVQIALDDFGTGYTSIAQLMKLPINLLKIDKSLIDDIESNNSIRDLVDSVIYMGHIMNCEVISEGVENEGQIDVLKEHNCDFVQGFVWGRPLALNDAQKLV